MNNSTQDTKKRIAAMNAELKLQGINYNVQFHPNTDYVYSIGERYSRTREYTNAFGHIVEQTDRLIRLKNATPQDLIAAMFL